MTEEELIKGQNLINSLKEIREELDEISELRNVPAGNLFKLKIDGMKSDSGTISVTAPFCLVEKWLEQLEDYYQERMKTLKSPSKIFFPLMSFTPVYWVTNIPSSSS